MDLGKEYLGAKVLVVESRCRSAHDLIPTARRLAQQLRQLAGKGYDVRAVTIRGIVVRDDQLMVPKCNLVLVDGELVEKSRAPRTADGHQVLPRSLQKGGAG